MSVSCSVYMALPNITDITALSKCKRKERHVLMSCYDILICIDAIDSAKVPKPAMECWLVAKLGLEKIMATMKFVKAFLESLTDAQLYLIPKTQYVGALP